MKRDSLIIAVLVGLFAASSLVGLFVFSKSSSDAPAATASGFSQKAGVGVVYVYGPLMTSQYASFRGPGGADALVKQIVEMTDDHRVKALVLRVNSPGGTVGASQEVFQAVQYFKKTTQKPVIVSIGDSGASGAYWVALSGDTILANAGSLVGSIGVIMQNWNFTQVQDRYGVGVNTVTSGKYKDLMSSWKPFDKDSKALLDAMVSDVHGQFVDVLMSQRSLTKKQALAVADGRIFTGKQAKELGLVDELGTFQDAVELAWQQAGMSGKPSVIDKSKPSFQQMMDMFRGNVNAFFPSAPGAIQQQATSFPSLR